MSDQSRAQPTKEPFSDPNPPKQGFRQSAAKAVALPLAAAGGAIAEVGLKVKELITGDHTKIDAGNAHHGGSIAFDATSSANNGHQGDPSSRSQSASDAD
ncbi:hypothetical protein BGW42_004652 [Actinomortierella wolfii]|nr:hypothetical protein BGW42_004652 [Actinomortierella wolfii]